MNIKKWRVVFTDGDVADVTAGCEEEAKILAFAERIKAGKPYDNFQIAIDVTPKEYVRRAQYEYPGEW